MTKGGEEGFGDRLGEGRGVARREREEGYRRGAGRRKRGRKEKKREGGERRGFS